MKFFNILNTAGFRISRFRKSAVITLAAFIIAAFDMNAAVSQNMLEYVQMGNQQSSGSGVDVNKALQSIQKGKNGLPASSLINTKPDEQKQQGAVSELIPGGTGMPGVHEIEEEPLSPIEEVFNTRLDPEKKIRQFGYDYFKREIPENFLPVGEGYKVGPGDSVSLYFWGDPVDILGLNGFYTITVDRDGKIFVPNLGVFYVWGLDILDIKEIIHSSLAKKFKRFEIALTLGQLRQFPVYVTGYVNKPGVVLSLGTYSIMDVLIQSGGVARNGSLRNIEIIRKGDKGTKRIKVDLYDLLIKGELVNIPVKEGDSILVNRIGKTAAVAGDVKRPAIYEIFENDSIKEAVDYAGGLSFSAYNANAKYYRYENDSVKVYGGALTDSGFILKKLSDGDCVSIDAVNSVLDNQITVEGYIKYPGTFEWKEGAKLGDLIRKAELLPDTDAGVADIKRKDSAEVVSFSPRGVLSGRGDINLRKRDIVTFYPRWLNEPMHISGEVEESKLVPFYVGIKLLDAIKQIKFNREPSLLKAEIYNLKKPVRNKDNQVIKKTVYLIDLLIRGDDNANIVLEPGDKIVIRNVESNEKNKTVTILGEVRRPGVYRYILGKKLSDIIEEAGGYTESAYPRGLIFTRKNAQKLQLNQINISMISMEEYVTKSSAGIGAAGGTDDEKSILAMMIKQQEEMLSLIKKKSTMALGRLALEIPADIKDLKESGDNIQLVEDDYIYIPAKPNYVLVLGNVYNQISMPHVKGKAVEDYLEDVGGPAKSSDLDNIYVIKANGKIISRESYEYKYGYTMSLFRSLDNMELEEGDAVVVPFEINIPVMWRPMLRDITQIIFQSLSALVLATSL